MINCFVINKNFLETSKLKETLGSGTFGKVSLYQQNQKLFVVKESVFKEKVTDLTKKKTVFGYPDYFINEIDKLIKFRPLIDTVVQLEGICMDADNRKSYIVLEMMDSDLEKWSKLNSTTFDMKMTIIQEYIQNIGGTLALMHNLNFIHNDFKLNNVLINYLNIPNPKLKLSDFGKTKYIDYSVINYGGITKYIYPFPGKDIYSIETWGFMLNLIELLIYPAKLFDSKHIPKLYIKETNKQEVMDDLKGYYNNFFMTDKGKFNIKKILKDNLDINNINKIPKIFWKVTKYICQNVNSNIQDALEYSGYKLDNTLKDIVYNNISHISDDKTCKGYLQFLCEHNILKSEIKSEIYEKYIILLSFFFNNIKNITDDNHNDNIKTYGSVIYYTVTGKKTIDFPFMETDIDKYIFLKMQEIFLNSINFQVLVLN